MPNLTTEFLNRNIDPDENYFNHSDFTDIFNSCRYFSVPEFETISQSKAPYPFIFSANVRSFYANFDKFELIFTSNKKPDILVLCETWFEDSNKCDLPNYHSFHTIRGRGGGISVYVKSDLNCHSIPRFSYQNSLIEINCVKVLLGDKWFFILGVYRPHGETVSNFVEELTSIFNGLNLNSKNVILIGDWNINLLGDNPTKDIFVNFMRSFNLFPTIDKPTRFSNNHDPSLLDNLWTNSTHLNTSGIVSVDFTDHLPIFIFFDTVSTSHEKVSIKFRNRSEHNRELFFHKVFNFDWNLVKNDDLNLYVSDLMHKMNEIFCDSFPLMTKLISKKRLSKPWITNEILDLINLKSTSFTLFRRNLISQSFNNSLKNRINSAVRKAKTDYYSRKFNAFKTNLRRTWEMIRQVLSLSKNRNTVKAILFNNTEVFDELEISNLFNNFFCNIPLELDSNIPVSSIDPLRYVTEVNSSLFLRPVTAQECSKVIHSLKNSKSHIDALPVDLFKKVSEVFSVVLADLTNKCFTSGMFPDPLKIACVTPVHKKGDTKLMSNYRPISVVHYLCKIIEKLILKRLNSFLLKFQILHDDQFGFREGKSTSDAIIRLLDYLYDAIDNNEFAIALFIDYQKAFDTVNRTILLRKIEKYGIRGRPLDLIASYLTNRCQYVKIGNSFSSKLPSNIGVPQGSNLSPLLFTLYINDLHNISPNISTILFADDSTLIFRNRNFNQLIHNCNSEIEIFRQWCIANRLSLNVDKTCALIFTNRNYDQNLVISFGSSPINICTEFTFLGVKIDRNLKFNLHTRYVSNKISKNIGILYKLSNYVPKPTLRSVYFSLIYPYLNYCNTVWGSTYAVHLYPIIKVQKRAIRIICKAPYLAHSDPLFSELKLLKLYDIHKYQILVYVYKNLDTFPNLTHRYATRYASNLRIQFRRTIITSRSVSCIGPKYWNALDPSLKCTEKLVIFKNNLKSMLISRYDC